MTAREMALKRWQGVSREERKRIARKGGRARRDSLSKRERKRIARDAANARWAQVRIEEMQARRRIEAESG